MSSYFLKMTDKDGDAVLINRDDIQMIEETTKGGINGMIKIHFRNQEADIKVKGSVESLSAMLYNSVSTYNHKEHVDEPDMENILDITKPPTQNMEDFQKRFEGDS